MIVTIKYKGDSEGLRRSVPILPDHGELLLTAPETDRRKTHATFL